MRLLTASVLLLCVAVPGGRGNGSFFQTLFSRGKSLLSRTLAMRKFDNTDPYPLAPEHREVNNGIALTDGFVPSNPYFLYHQHSHNHHNHEDDVQHHHHNHHLDNGRNKGGYKITYHTDIIEKNNNMHLYNLIGGLSFASLLATAFLILSRRNGTMLRSLEDNYHRSAKKEDPPYDKVLTKLWW